LESAAHTMSFTIDEGGCLSWITDDSELVIISSSASSIYAPEEGQSLRSFADYQWIPREDPTANEHLFVNSESMVKSPLVEKG